MTPAKTSIHAALSFAIDYHWEVIINCKDGKTEFHDCKVTAITPTYVKVNGKDFEATVELATISSVILTIVA
jgi:hypothetical protein